MAVGRYKGINNVSRKVKKYYREGDNVAREVERRYRGFNNVARLVYSNDDRTYLFKDGSFNLNLTTGYLTKTGNDAISDHSTGWFGDDAIMGVENNYIYNNIQDYSITSATGSNSWGVIYTATPIDVTNYSKIGFKYDVEINQNLTAAKDEYYIKLGVFKYPYFETDLPSIVHLNTEIGNQYGVEETLDISSFDESLYVGMASVRSYLYATTEQNDGITFRIYEIWFE